MTEGFKCSYFPEETELTDAIYAALNKHSVAIMNACENSTDFIGKDILKENIADAAYYGGFARVADNIVVNSDPTNLIAYLTVVYETIDKRQQQLLSPVIKEISNAIAEAKKRNPTGELIGMLASRQDVKELFSNQNALG